MRTVAVWCNVVHETHRAFCVEIPGMTDIWLPKRFTRLTQTGVIIPLWLAKDRAIPGTLLELPNERPLHGWEQ